MEVILYNYLIQINYTVDNVYDDDDYDGSLSIEDINNIVESEILNELEMEIKNILVDLNLGENTDINNPIDIVIAGGICRIIRIKNFLRNLDLDHNIYGYLNKKLVETLNFDDNGSYGCCYYKLLKKDKVKFTFENEAEDLNKYNKQNYIKIDNINNNPKSFIDIDISLEQLNPQEYYKKLLENHIYLLLRNKETLNIIADRNTHESEWYIYYIQ